MIDNRTWAQYPLLTQPRSMQVGDAVSNSPVVGISCNSAVIGYSPNQWQHVHYL